MTIKIRTIQDALTTGAGPQSITLTGFDETVRAALAIVSSATANATDTNHAVFSLGCTDGTTESVITHMGEHSQNPSDSYRRMETDEFVSVLTTTGAVDGEANSSLITDGFQLTIGNQFAAAYLLKGILFGDDGSDLSVKCGTFTHTGAQDAEQFVTGLFGSDIAPDVVFFWTNTGPTGSSGASMVYSFGWAVNDGGGAITQAASVYACQDNLNPIQSGAGLFDNRCQVSPSTPGSVNRALEMTTMDSTSSGRFGVTKRTGSGNIECHYLALNFNGKIEVVGNHHNSPTVTEPADQAYTWPGHTPQCVMLFPAGVPATNTMYATGTNGAGIMYVGCMDADNEWCIGVNSSDAASPADTQSRASTKAIDVDRDNSTQIFEATGPSGSGSFDDDTGYTLNVTVDLATAKKWAGLSFEAADAAQSVGASPAIALWSVPAPTLISASQTLNAVPAEARWDALASTLLLAPYILTATIIEADWDALAATLSPASRVLLAAPVEAQWAVPAPTLVPAPISIGAVSAEAQWNVPAPALTGGSFTLTPAPVEAEWNAPAATLTPGSIARSENPVAAQWESITPALQPGAVALQASPIEADWSVVTPLLLPGPINVVPPSSEAQWNVPAPTLLLTGGPQSVSPAPAEAQWSVPAPILLPAPRILALSPVLAQWAVPAAQITGGAITLGAVPAIGVWSVPVPQKMLAGRILQASSVVGYWNAVAPALVRAPRVVQAVPGQAQWNLPAFTLIQPARTLTPAPVTASWNVLTPVFFATQTITPGVAAPAWAVGVPGLTLGAFIHRHQSVTVTAIARHAEYTVSAILRHGQHTVRLQ